MFRAVCVLAIVVAGLASVWGCGRSSPPLSINSPNAAALEARIQKLERDFRAVESARDAAVARAADFEARLKAEAARAAAIQRDRDDLSANLKARVVQAEVVQTQLDGLKKGLKDLLGSMESAAAVVPAVSFPTSAAVGVPLSSITIAP